MDRVLSPRISFVFLARSVYAKVDLNADRKDKVVFAPQLLSQIQDTEKDLQGTIRFLRGKA